VGTRLRLRTSLERGRADRRLPGRRGRGPPLPEARYGGSGGFLDRPLYDPQRIDGSEGRGRWLDAGREGQRVAVRGVGWDDFDGLFALRLSRYDEIDRDPNYGMVSLAARPTVGEFSAWFGELHKALLEGRAICSVVEEDGRVVGMCSVRADSPHVETRHVGTLGIEILAPYRGRGLGAALLSHALEACRGRFEEVHLAVIPVNEGARRLYERMGFEVYGTAPRAFRRGSTYHDFVLMRKRIS
jgi:RimJ/RimL family protein N-acetyltransferase